MSIDKLFDKLDELADEVVPILKNTHVGDDVEDAEVVHEEVNVILGLVDEGWHLFRGVTNRTFCRKTVEASRIEARKRINPDGFTRVCCGCLAVAFETQSKGSGDGK